MPKIGLFLVVSNRHVRPASQRRQRPTLYKRAHGAVKLNIITSRAIRLSRAKRVVGCPTNASDLTFSDVNQYQAVMPKYIEHLWWKTGSPTPGGLVEEMYRGHHDPQLPLAIA